jgi:predicted nucleic acid-binding protein
VSIVLDTSATLAFLMDEERNSKAVALFVRISAFGAIVPNLWPYEGANSLSMAVKRGRIEQRS